MKSTIGFRHDSRCGRPLPCARRQCPGADALGAVHDEARQRPAADISEQKLDAAAKAVKNVSTIRDSYEQKLIKAPADQKAKLADEASDAMAKAVKDQGLSVEEYTEHRSRSHRTTPSCATSCCSG